MSEPTLYRTDYDDIDPRLPVVLDLVEQGVLVPVEFDRERIANHIAVEYLPDTGPCAFCDSEVGARHRVADAIVDEVLALLGIGGDDEFELVRADRVIRRVRRRLDLIGGDE